MLAPSFSFNNVFYNAVAKQYETNSVRHVAYCNRLLNTNTNVHNSADTTSGISLISFRSFFSTPLSVASEFMSKSYKDFYLFISSVPRVVTGFDPRHYRARPFTMLPWWDVASPVSTHTHTLST